jgi:hypothetical protein
MDVSTTLAFVYEYIKYYLSRRLERPAGNAALSPS